MALRNSKDSLVRWSALAPVSLLAVFLIGAARAADQQVVHAGAARAHPDPVFSIQGRVTMLAADGNRAAVTTKVKRACARRIVVWTAPGRRSTRVKPGILGCAGDGVSELAVGGGRVAWIEQGGGNSLEMAVMAARLTGGGARKQLEFATNGDRASGDPSGDWVGRLLGSGSLLAYNRWTQICDRPEVEGCGHNDPQLRLADQKLIRVAAGQRALVLGGPAAYPLVAVGGGRMALAGADGLTIRAASGAQVATVSDAGGSARAVALSSTRLAIERRSTLDLYDPATGAAVKSLALGWATSLRLAGVTSKLALLRGPHRLVLVGLTDGRVVSFPLRRAVAATLVGARLTEAGLFYAYNTHSTSPGRIVFEPIANLSARF
jgi:hypothetical protein